MDIKIFDSHAHYDDDMFSEDREVVIELIRKAGVIGVLNCGSSIEGARMSVELSKRYDMFYAAVGIHPEYADNFTDRDFDEIRIMAQYDKVKAIGEIGLDYYWQENPSKTIQQEVFKKQMKLAEELELPVVIHDREAHEDTLNIIKEFPKVRGVVHCFSRSAEFAKQCIKAGYYIGITGVVTFKNAKKIIDVVKEIPLERLLVETDCPYMAPTPYRGKRNQSDYILHIMEEIAKIKGVTVEKISEQTIQNASDLLNLK